MKELFDCLPNALKLKHDMNYCEDTAYASNVHSNTKSFELTQGSLDVYNLIFSEIETPLVSLAYCI